VPIVAGWLDAAFNSTGEEPTPDVWLKHWKACIEQAAAADIVLLYAREDETQMGALIEAGAALGAGKEVWCVSPHEWSFRHHPRVRNFRSLDEAVRALVVKRRAKGGPAGCDSVA
jgi:hypothetical protein